MPVAAAAPAEAAGQGDQARAGLGQHGRRRLTVAPPRTRRPRWTPPGSSFVPAGSIRADGRPTRRVPRQLRAPGTADAPFEAVARPRRPAARDAAPDQPRRSRRPAGPHARRDRRDRRPLPAHERAAVDRRARRLRRRLPAPRGPVRPVHRRAGPDADDRRPRSRRRLPPDLVAGRSRRRRSIRRARRPRRAG